MKNHLNTLFAMLLCLSLAAATFITDLPASAEDSGGATSFESLDYFNITEGHGIRYHVTDDNYNPNCNVWAVSQYSETNKPNELDFVVTLIREGEGFFGNSSMGGLISRSIGGNDLTCFYAGYPVGNQANFYFNFSLPRFFNSGDEWSWVNRSYRVEHVGTQTVGGVEFSDCIRIDIDDSQNASEYVRGTGHFILAQGVGIVRLVFNRATGEHVLFEYLGHEQLTKHTISGTIIDSEVPVEGIIVQISNANCGIRSVTGSTGTFSIDVYGPDIVLRIGYDQDNNDVFEFDFPNWPKEYCVNNIISDILGLSIVVENTIPLGSISGRVIDSLTGQAVSGSRVEVSDYQTNLGHREATTDADGYYTVNGLPTGQYRVQVCADGYISEWYPDTYVYDEATPVSVTVPGDTPNIDFNLELGGSISGHVFEADGLTPISNVLLRAMDATTHVSIAESYTSPDGSYTMVGLPTGSYIVQALPSHGGLDLIDQYYSGVYNWAQATPVPVTAPGDTPNIDFNLDAEGSISGHFMDGATGEPISGALIIVYDYSSGEQHGYASTDVDGYYSVAGIPTGQYRVQARATGYISEWYQDTTNYWLATPVLVTAPDDTPNIDFSLDIGGSISGRVIDSVTGQPISGAKVYACDYYTGLGYSGPLTNEQGYYIINDLPDGEYRVQAEASGHAREWYQDTYDLGEATIVSVAAPNDTSGIDFDLEPEGSISGQAIDGATGLPISGAYVNVYDYSVGYLLRSQQTRSDGTYTVEGLPTGVYRVEIFNAPGYINEYYQNTYLYSEATPVPVTAPGDTPSINFSLELGGSISGYVYEADGTTPIPGIVLHAISCNTALASTSTGSDGHYVLGSLPSGSYSVLACASLTGMGYLDQLYDGMSPGDEATLVSVIPPDDTPNIDFSLSRLYETPVGQNVVISDPYTGVTTEFSSVADGGNTSIIESENNPGGDSADFRLIGNYYDITTDASYEGTITVTIAYNEGDIPEGTVEEELRLLHWDESIPDWVDVTQSVDTVNNTITGMVDSLSWFALAEPNEPPVAEASITPYLAAVGTEFIIDANMSYDPDGTIVAYEWDFGDGTTSNGETVAHVYSNPGVYSVVLTVTDDLGAQATDTVMAVVYDPESGFVTGGGWINSPEGAYCPDSSLSGKATFGFVAKYKKGADIPTGQTEFQFKVANFSFHSTNYDWLVIAGAKAMYKGTGTVNGEGEFRFILSAIDADVNGNDDHTVDRFRLKVWNEVTGDVVYDNQMGDTNDSDATMEIGGGSIVIHSGK